MGTDETSEIRRHGTCFIGQQLGFVEIISLWLIMCLVRGQEYQYELQYSDTVWSCLNHFESSWWYNCVRKGKRDAWGLLFCNHSAMHVRACQYLYIFFSPLVSCRTLDFCRVSLELSSRTSILHLLVHLNPFLFNYAQICWQMEIHSLIWSLSPIRK